MEADLHAVGLIAIAAVTAVVCVKRWRPGRTIRTRVTSAMGAGLAFLLIWLLPNLAHT